MAQTATIDHPKSTLLIFRYGGCGRQEFIGTQVLLWLALPILFLAASCIPSYSLEN